MTLAWRIDAQTLAAGLGASDMALPIWLDGAPFCATTCPHRAQLECRLTKLHAPRTCEPVVKQMAALLSAGPQ